MKIKYFKSEVKTNRLNKNQKVFVTFEYCNHLEVTYKYRNKGNRYVKGLLNKFDKCVGKFIEIDVPESFYNYLLQGETAFYLPEKDRRLK